MPGCNLETNCPGGGGAQFCRDPCVLICMQSAPHSTYRYFSPVDTRKQGAKLTFWGSSCVAVQRCRSTKPSRKHTAPIPAATPIDTAAGMLCAARLTYCSPLVYSRRTMPDALGTIPSCGAPASPCKQRPDLKRTDL